MRAGCAGAYPPHSCGLTWFPGSLGGGHSLWREASVSVGSCVGKEAVTQGGFSARLLWAE